MCQASQSVAAFQQTVDQNLDRPITVQAVVTANDAVQIAVGHDETSGETVRIRRVLSPGCSSRIAYEVNQLRSLSGDSVPQFVCASSSDDCALIVSQEHDDTARRVGSDCVPMQFRMSLRAGVSMFLGLHAYHQAGLVFGYVDPSQLLVSETGKSTLLDKYDCKTHLDSDNDAKLQVAMFGSPEFIGAIEGDVAIPSDLYSAGCILFYMLAGHPPYSGDDVSSVLLSKMTNDIPTLNAHRVSAPHVLEQIMHRLLSKTPNDRYQTSLAVAKDLEAVLQAVDTGVRDPSFVIGGHDVRDTLVEPSFVGRESELQRIAQHLESASSGSSELVMLEGESGSGKTRLLDEVARRAVSNGFCVLQGSGTTDGFRGHMAIFNEFATTHAQVIDDRFNERFEGEFNGDVGVLAQSFPALELGTDCKAAAGEYLTESRTVQTVCAYLSSIGRAARPALLIIDD
ncbi:MAG: DUF2791 family P-loop domain-containing protein, partial [Planctomycetales bacterium]|nr:DUF2791 family P-loop domain-containing protein [Planctomycetales bacterium]